MAIFEKRDEPITDCEWKENGTILHCDVRQKVGDLDFEGSVDWRKGKDGQLHRLKHKGLPLATVEELEKRAIKR